MNTVDLAFSWLLRASWQASVMVGLVLLAQWIFRNRLSPAWRYTLWLLVLARLVIPVPMESRFSVFNIDRDTPARILRKVRGWSEVLGSKSQESVAGSPKTEVGSQGTEVSSRELPISNRADAARSTKATVLSAVPASTAAPLSSLVTSPSSLLLPLWLAGACFLLLRTIWQNARFSRRVLSQRQVTDSGALDVLEDVKDCIKVRTPLTVIETPEVRSPALFGFVRPRLVLPEGTLAAFSRQELYYIFLHELAHVKRWDMAVNWLMSGLRSLHWFNPILWYAFRRMDADRELATDALALAYAPDDGRGTYGRTIVKLLENFTRSTALPGLVGILENKREMIRRITMISQFKKMTDWSAAAAALVLGMGIVTLTDGPHANAATPVPSANANVKVIESGYDIASGVLSPDKTAIAYVDWDNPKGEGILTVKELKTGQTRTLTAGSSANSDDYRFADSPVWSPDSREIAYHGEEDVRDSAILSLCIVQRAGGAPKVVSKNNDNNFEPSDWSKDGRLILGVRVAKGTRTLAILAVDTGAIRTIGRDFTGTDGPRAPRFSPDARFIVFERTDGGNRHIYLTNLADGNPVRLTASTSEESYPIFTSDGRFVLFNSNRTSVWGLWVLPVANGKASGEPFQVSYNFGDYEKTVTAAGDVVFTNTATGGFRSSVNHINIVDATDSRSVANGSGANSRTELRMGPDGTLFSDGPGSDSLPEWSTDGRKIAFLRTGTALGHPFTQICVKDVATQDLQTYELAFYGAGPGMIFWSPDSSSLALMNTIVNGVRALRIFSVASGKISAPINIGDPTLGFSTDGKELIVWRKDKGGRIAINITDKTERVLSTTAEISALAQVSGAQHYDVSRDGARVAFLAKDGTENQLVIADAGDLSNRRILVHATSRGTAIAHPRFSPDRTKIAYFLGRHLHIGAVDGSWDAEVQRGEGPPPAARMSWSPDGTKLAMGVKQTLPAQLTILSNYMPPTVAAK